MSGRQRVGAIGLLVIAIVVGVITLTPATIDSGRREEIELFLAALHRVGLPTGFGYNQLEVTANVIMFMPLGFFGGLLAARRWWLAALALPAASIFIEVTQLLFLPGRVAALSDVFANSLGGWIGLLMSLVVVRRWAPERQPASSTPPSR